MLNTNFPPSHTHIRKSLSTTTRANVRFGENDAPWTSAGEGHPGTGSGYELGTASVTKSGRHYYINGREVSRSEAKFVAGMIARHAARELKTGDGTAAVNWAQVKSDAERIARS